MRKICILISFILLAFNVPIQAKDSDKFNKTWQHLAVKEILDEPLGNEEAIIWHLDTNSFAVRLPDCVMIFDYDNEEPCPQYYKRYII